jgi:hypothetical protein
VKKAPFAVGTGMPDRERFCMCEVPTRSALPPCQGLADATPSDQISAVVTGAELLRGDGDTVGAPKKNPPVGPMKRG